jgi:hypothetical protein
MPKNVEIDVGSSTRRRIAAHESPINDEPESGIQFQCGRSSGTSGISGLRVQVGESRRMRAVQQVPREVRVNVI